jgi:ABC-type branched-subunit amino acid transport system ATPase component
MLIVEQYVDRVLAIADFVCVVVHGRIVHSSLVADVDRETLAAHYMSVT